MEPFIQPKISGYRQLSEQEAGLMNEGKHLAAQVGAYIDKLRSMPSTQPTARVSEEEQPVLIDQRWVSIGATQIQQGFMAVVRGIAKPNGF